MWKGRYRRSSPFYRGELPVAVIIAGVHKLRDGIMTDPETDRRFPKFELTSITEGSREARTFARSMQLCADKIGLSLPENAHLPERILFVEGGVAGRCTRLAKGVLGIALDEGRAEVTLQDARLQFELE